MAAIALDDPGALLERHNADHAIVVAQGAQIFGIDPVAGFGEGAHRGIVGSPRLKR